MIRSTTALERRAPGVGRYLSGLIALGLLASLLIISGPASAADPVTVRVSIINETKSNNPFVGNMGWYPTSLMYDWLVGESPVDRSPVPAFAKSWTASADYTTWTFKIWPGIKWSDGEPATARDAAFTYNYVIKSKGTGHELRFLSDIARDIASAEAVDDETLVIKTTHPIYWAYMNSMRILPEHVWKDVTYEAASTNFQPPYPLVGTGPFIPVEHVDGQSLTMERNPNYRGDLEGNKPSIDRIVFVYYKSPDAEAQALKVGEVDASIDILATQLKQLTGEPNIFAFGGVTNQHRKLDFNVSTDPASKASTAALRDPAFRDALAYAIDQKTLLDKVVNGVGITAPSIVGPAIPLYHQAVNEAIKPIKRTFNLDEAKRRLDAAGYALGADGIRVDKEGKPLNLRLFISTASTDFATAAEFVVDWFGQIGVKVTTTAVEAQALSAMYKTPAEGGGDWDLILQEGWGDATIAWVLGSASASSLGVWNAAGWVNQQFEDLAAQAVSAPQLADRQRLAGEAFKIWYQDAPTIVLWYNARAEAYRTDRFDGWVRDLNGQGQFGYSYFQEQSWTRIRPVGAEASAVPSTGASAAPDSPGKPAGSSDGSTGLIVGAAVVVVVLVGGTLLLRRRRAA